jgi:hypothetical protein
MKTLILIIITLTPIHILAQECDIDEWIGTTYRFDASFLALKEIQSNPTHEYTDSINIPDTLINKYLKLFTSIYHLKTSRTDSIFLNKEIHVFPDIPYNSLVMTIDTSYEWIRNYLIDSVTSGYNSFDSVTTLYNFTLVHIWHSINAITIQSESVLNVRGLVPVFEKLNGLSDIEAYCNCEGDGNDIQVNYNADTAVIEFSVAWGDCPSGCMNRHYWKYEVANCQAEFKGAFGDPFTSLNSLVTNENIMFPNPITDKLYFSQDFRGIKSVQIFNLSGNFQNKYEVIDNEIDLRDLKAGIYILKIQYDDKTNSVKIIKR